MSRFDTRVTPGSGSSATPSRRLRALPVGCTITALGAGPSNRLCGSLGASRHRFKAVSAPWRRRAAAMPYEVVALNSPVSTASMNPLSTPAASVVATWARGPSTIRLRHLQGSPLLD
jgi:hypothetical protein